MPQYGTYVGRGVEDGDPNLKRRKPCARCGRLRYANEGGKRVAVSTNLCRDCYACLTEEERRLWA
jgi:hypothetical protein